MSYQTSPRIFACRNSITTLLALIATVLATSALHAAREVSVTLGWEPNPEERVEGYIVYYGTESGVYDNSIDVGLSTEAIVPDLIEGTGYYFVVTAYNGTDIEGLPSEELDVLPVVRITPDDFQPTRIDGFTRSVGETVNFKLSGGSGAARVLLYASSDLMNWTLLKEINGSAATLDAVDSDADDEPRRFYRVTTEFQEEL